MSILMFFIIGNVLGDCGVMTTTESVLYWVAFGLYCVYKVARVGYAFSKR